jgi:predicted metal-binding membrane protein
MSEAAGRPQDLTPAAAGGWGAAFARPQAVAGICVVALTGLGWLYLALLTGRANSFAAFCGPLAVTWTVNHVALVALMWAAMAFAMMLPSAGPMILTYAEIADTAARKGQRIVAPAVLVAGYAAVWFGFAVVAALAQFAAAGLDLTSPLLAAAIFVAAGLYQFTPLKHACLTQCQRPFPFFFAHWQTAARGVFRLGLQQGLYCLGCCWVMMLVMFAVGAMNIAWMAALAVVMTIEKMLTGPRFSQAVGVVLIGAGVLVASI